MPTNDRPTYVTDVVYKRQLLDILRVTDPADSAHQASIPALEGMIVTLGLDLPIVRRITPEPMEFTDGSETQNP